MAPTVSLARFLVNTSAPDDAVPLHLISSADFAAWKDAQPETIRRWLSRSGCTGKKGQTALLPDANGGLRGVLHIRDGGSPAIWTIAGLSTDLPVGVYRLADDIPAAEAEQLALGWLLGCYRFDRYRQRRTEGDAPPEPSRLLTPPGCDTTRLIAIADSIAWVRDLINTPAEDMGPSQLAAAAGTLASKYHATCGFTVDEALLDTNYPAIYAVGRAATNRPRLIDLRWGDASHRKITLVGKGVCFDSGGLDLKSASNMLLMKKDMGGAAMVLGLSRLIMATDLPISLRVLVPAVENAVAGNAYRPGDVLATRKGLSVEIDNTDAEGRLVLCDALTEADSESPDLIIDCATLTGAARVALGTDIPAIFSTDAELAERLVALGAAHHDPLWQLPLWQDYRKELDSTVADIKNSSSSGYAGAITAALFLKEFVTVCPRWLHLDMMAWNLKARPGRPVGGEAMGLRALYALLLEICRI